MVFKKFLENFIWKRIFPPSWAAASLLARLPKPAQPASPARASPRSAQPSTSRAGLLTPSRAALASAQPRAVPLLAARPRADRGRDIPPRGDHVPASPAARQPRPEPAPTRPPTPAGAGALAQSRPHCLPSPPEQKAEAPPLAAPAAPPASSSRTTAPFPDSSRPQLRLAFLQVALALAPPPSTGRASPRLATDGHGAAVLGRRGTPPSYPSPPCLAACPHSPTPREPQALARLP